MLSAAIQRLGESEIKCDWNGSACEGRTPAAISAIISFQKKLIAAGRVYPTPGTIVPDGQITYNAVEAFQKIVKQNSAGSAARTWISNIDSLGPRELTERVYSAIKFLDHVMAPYPERRLTTSNKVNIAIGVGGLLALGVGFWFIFKRK